jgi:hypothetical protein
MSQLQLPDERFSDQREEVEGSDGREKDHNLSKFQLLEYHQAVKFYLHKVAPAGACRKAKILAEDPLIGLQLRLDLTHIQICGVTLQSYDFIH